MKRTTVNLILDGLAALLMMGLVCTGIILRFALPPGSNKDRSLWNLGRHQWGDVHFWLAVALLLVVLLHVANHWTWVVAVTIGRKSKVSSRTRWFSGVVFLVVLTGLVAGFSWFAMRHARQDEDARRAARSGLPHRESAAELQGSMSLSQAADVTGLPMEEVRRRLGLPDSVADSETLGRLGRQYGFTLPEARARLSEPPSANGGRP